MAFSKFIRFGGVEGWGICASQVRNEMFQQLLAYGCRRFGDYIGMEQTYQVARPSTPERPPVLWQFQIPIRPRS